MSAKRVINHLVVYAYGAIAVTIGGGAAAFLTTIGGSMLGAEAFTPGQLWATAIGGGIVSLASYLWKSPLPKLRVNKDGELDVDEIDDPTGRAGDSGVIR